MSKKSRKRNSLVILHVVGIFLLVMLWFLAIYLKSALGNFVIPVFIALVGLTLAGLYFLNKLLFKSLSS